MKNRHKKFNKFELMFVLSVAISVCVYFLYQKLLGLYFKMRYDGFLFANLDKDLIIIFCCYIVLAVSCFFSKERKMKPVKYWSVFSGIGIIVFLFVFYFNTNVWVATTDNILYARLFADAQISYDYSELNNAVLYYNKSSGIKMRGISPEYDLCMSDGKKITWCLFDGYFKSYEDLIEFDKAIADKRTTNGEFISLHTSKKLNAYYESIF